LPDGSDAARPFNGCRRGAADYASSVNSAGIFEERARPRLVFVEEGGKAEHVQGEACEVSAGDDQLGCRVKAFESSLYRRLVSTGFGFTGRSRTKASKATSSDAASIATSRRRRRAKTDKIDGETLVRVLLAYKRGEPRVCAMVKVPTPGEEDRRHLCRERNALTAERVRHVNRIKGLLFSQGVSGYQPLRRDRRQRLEELQTGDGRAFPQHLKALVNRELDRLELLLKQIKTVEAARDALLAVEQTAKPTPAAMLLDIRGIGPELRFSYPGCPGTRDRPRFGLCINPADEGPRVRIRLPPAASQQTFGSSQDDARCSTIGRIGAVTGPSAIKTPTPAGPAPIAEGPRMINRGGHSPEKDATESAAVVHANDAKATM
jgi:hypothetical protein